MAQILIIDDDPAIRVTIEQILQSAGHAVISAGDGRQGVEMFRANPADLVITDLYMPNQEGLETIRELRTRFPKLVILAMSGRPTAGTMLSIAQKLGGRWGSSETVSAPGITGSGRKSSERTVTVSLDLRSYAHHLSLISQRHDRMDFCGTTGRDIASQQGHDAKR